MEYLLDQTQYENAARLIEHISAEDLAREVETLRAACFKCRFGETPPLDSLHALSDRAFLLGALGSNTGGRFPEQLRAKALSVAGVVFEYMCECAQNADERQVYALDAILFFSLGEQEAEASSVAHRLRNRLFGDGPATGAPQADVGWDLLLSFLERDFRTLLRWWPEHSLDPERLQPAQEPESEFWRRLLEACVQVAGELVWGLESAAEDSFSAALAEARSLGSSHLTWMAARVRDVCHTMLDRSLRKRMEAVGVPGWMTETYTMDGIVEMWLPHRAALQGKGNMSEGILSDACRVSLANMPTSAGKSLLGEMVVLRQLAEDPSAKAIWVVPSRALVHEVRQRLERRLRRLGLGVSSVPGGFERDPNEDHDIASASVLVLTPEKLDGLLRRSPAAFRRVRVCVVDEVHKIGDQDDRAWLLETVVAWLLASASRREDLRLVFMSAVLPNQVEFESWLGKQRARFVSRWTSWRPTRLALLATTQGPAGWHTTLIQRHRDDEVFLQPTLSRGADPFQVVVDLVLRLEEQGAARHGTLVFFYTKDKVTAFVPFLADRLPDSDCCNSALEALARSFAGTYGLEHPFTRAIRRGVGVDHGDVPMWLRHGVEDAFREGTLPLLVSNQTILEGVNFPMRNLIVADLGSQRGREFRFRLGLRSYVNLVGRVGRAMVDTEGMCFLVRNWFYDRAVGEGPRWGDYVSPQPQLGPARSYLVEDEASLTRHLRRLVASAEGADEATFAELGHWRDRLERLHSCALAFLEQTDTPSYKNLYTWMSRTLAWHQATGEGRAALAGYAHYACRVYDGADRQVYALAASTGLPVRLARGLDPLAQRVVERCQQNEGSTFADLYGEHEFELVVQLTEYARHPVVYGSRWHARVDHYRATLAWVLGQPWGVVSQIVAAQHSNLVQETRAHIVASYVSQMFEYRVPWVLGAIAEAARRAGASEEIVSILQSMPGHVRYGVPSDEAVAICRYCAVDRSDALVFAEKYRNAGRRVDMRQWLGTVTLDNLREWFPEDSEQQIESLHLTMRRLRGCTFALRRDRQATVNLAGWRHFEWDLLCGAAGRPPRGQIRLRRETNNASDPFAVAVDVVTQEARVQVGYVPLRESEQLAELLDWGWNVAATWAPTRGRTPRLHLQLLPWRVRPSAGPR